MCECVRRELRVWTLWRGARGVRGGGVVSFFHLPFKTPTTLLPLFFCLCLPFLSRNRSLTPLVTLTMSTGDLDNNLAAAQVALRHLRAPAGVVGEAAGCVKRGGWTGKKICTRSFLSL